MPTSICRKGKAWLSCSMDHLQQGLSELALAQQMCCRAHTLHTGRLLCPPHLQARPWHGSAAAETSWGLAKNNCCCAHHQGAATQLYQDSSAGMAMAWLSCGGDWLDFWHSRSAAVPTLRYRHSFVSSVGRAIAWLS